MANILSQADLEALIATLIPDNSSGDVSPKDVRDVLQAMIDSGQAYGGVIADGNVPVIEITGTPAKYTHFSSNATSANDIMEADADNDRILVKASGLFFVSLQFLGSWQSNEDLQFEVYVNGIPNAITPVILPKAGKGAGNPETIMAAEIGFLVTSAMITAGGGQATVELYASSLTGTFNLEQTDVTLGLKYNPYSIGTV